MLPAEPAAVPLDDRSPYEIALAVLRTIVACADGVPDEQAVIDEILELQGHEAHGYLTSIARAQHSIFYHQLQALYEFAKSRVRPEARDDFCLRAGREFMSELIAENAAPLHQIARAAPGEFQATVIATARAYLERYSDGKYVLEAELLPERVALQLFYRRPEVVRAHVEQCGLDPATCLENSTHCIAGAIDLFCSRAVVGYRAQDFRTEFLGDRLRFEVPIAPDDRFDYACLMNTLLGHIRVLEEQQTSQAEDQRLEEDVILGSERMAAVWRRVLRVARSEELVLLLGESGTGKSHIARRIHELSPRRDGPLVEVALTSDVGADNLLQSDLFGHERGAFTGASGPKQGLFSLAHRGTIFLDEIGDASADLQARLLRVIETKRFRCLGGVRDLEVDVRVLAATNRDLEQMVEQGTFRRDLYYRLNVIPIELPPLRERSEDIPALAQLLLARMRRSQRVPPLDADLAAQLARHAWPGNIRELDHALKHAAVLAEGAELSARDFPPVVQASLEAAPVLPDVVLRPSGAPCAGVRRALVDLEALREVLRACGSRPPEGIAPTELPGHIEHARREWLGVLIDELDGDLARIACYWDRNSEKTLRAQIRTFGLAERLATARVRARARL